MSVPIMAITTNSSTIVKPERGFMIQTKRAAGRIDHEGRAEVRAQALASKAVTEARLAGP